MKYKDNQQSNSQHVDGKATLSIIILTLNTISIAAHSIITYGMNNPYHKDTQHNIRKVVLFCTSEIFCSVAL